MRQTITAAILVAVVSTSSLAQQGQAGGPILTLEEAIQLALRNNPAHQRSMSSEDRASAQIRAAYGQWLPSVSSSLGGSFRAGGTEFFAGQAIGAASDRLSSSYSINVNAGWSAASLMQPRVARANLNAAEADVAQSVADTRSLVVTQYINVLRAQASAALQDTLLANSQAQLELNRAREQVGAATSLEVRNAEVTLGQTQVALLRERNNVEIALLRLYQTIGIDAVDGTRLVTTFPMSEPTLQLQELLEMARRANPALNAARARESASQVAVTQERAAWLPSLSFSTGWSGTQFKETNIEPSIASAMAQTEASRRSCLTTDSLRTGAGLAARGCDGIVFTPAMEQAIRDRNSRYPFEFEKNPFGYSIGLSLPIFDRFQRETRIQNASLARNESRYQVRAQELQINTDVTQAFRNLITQFRTVQVQEQNRAAAQQALDLATERYRVGASTFLDVTQARGQFERAGTDLINAIYDFHTFFAQLEAAVGRPLR